MNDLNIDEVLIDKGFVYIGFLGSGGFGSVFKVKEKLTENEFAIKVLNAKSRHNQINILREIKTLGRLNHPNIINYKSSFKSQENLYLVMEHCTNGNLLHYLSSEKISFEGVMDMMIKLTDTFSYLHEKGFVHHDIKPANILISEDKAIKISDFGTINTSIGTILYSAPEMLEGNPTINDPRVDVYSLGITLLEILNNSHPFQGLSMDSMLVKIKNADFPIDHFEPWLQHIILKACHHNPNVRFQTMGEFRDTLINRKIPIFLTKSLIKADFPIDHFEPWLQHIILKACHHNPNVRFQTMGEFRDTLINRKIPIFLTKSLIKDEKIVQKLRFHLQMRQWSKVRSILFAGYVGDNNLGFTILTGKYYLATHDMSNARKAFENASLINRNASVEKELVEIYLSEDQTSKASSLLLGYLNRNFFDQEAINLLLHTYFLSGRWELGLDQATLASEIYPESAVIRSNLFLFKGLNQDLSKENLAIASTPFIDYNKSVFLEGELSSWNFEKSPFLYSKLLFHEFRFLHLSKSTNTIIFQIGDKEFEESKTIISFGRKGYEQNDYALFDDSEVSRRHFVIINNLNNVWLYDLGSYSGVYVDDSKVEGKCFLLGRHIISFGKQKMILRSNKNILL